MSMYARGWMFGALCSMSALAGGWAVAATLVRSDVDARSGHETRPSPSRGSEPMSDRIYFSEHPRLIAC